MPLPHTKVSKFSDWKFHKVLDCIYENLATEKSSAWLSKAGYYTYHSSFGPDA